MTFLLLQQPPQVGEAYRVGTVGLLPPRVFARPGAVLLPSSPLSLKPFQDEDQLAEDGAVILPLERIADLLRVADI
jgi:hypothetical protein